MHAHWPAGLPTSDATAALVVAADRRAALRFPCLPDELLRSIDARDTSTAGMRLDQLLEATWQQVFSAPASNQQQHAASACCNTAQQTPASRAQAFIDNAYLHQTELHGSAGNNAVASNILSLHRAVQEEQQRVHSCLSWQGPEECGHIVNCKSALVSYESALGNIAATFLAAAAVHEDAAHGYTVPNQSRTTGSLSQSFEDRLRSFTSVHPTSRRSNTPTHVPHDISAGPAVALTVADKLARRFMTTHFEYTRLTQGDQTTNDQQAACITGSTDVPTIHITQPVQVAMSKTASKSCSPDLGHLPSGDRATAGLKRHSISPPTGSPSVPADATYLSGRLLPSIPIISGTPVSQPQTFVCTPAAKPVAQRRISPSPNMPPPAFPTARLLSPAGTSRVQTEPPPPDGQDTSTPQASSQHTAAQHEASQQSGLLADLYNCQSMPELRHQQPTGTVPTLTELSCTEHLDLQASPVEAASHGIIHTYLCCACS